MALRASVQHDKPPLYPRFTLPVAASMEPLPPSLPSPTPTTHHRNITSKDMSQALISPIAYRSINLPPLETSYSANANRFDSRSGNEFTILGSSPPMKPSLTAADPSRQGCTSPSCSFPNLLQELAPNRREQHCFSDEEIDSLLRHFQGQGCGGNSLLQRARRGSSPLPKLISSSTQSLGNVFQTPVRGGPTDFSAAAKIWGTSNTTFQTPARAKFSDFSTTGGIWGSPKNDAEKDWGTPTRAGSTEHSPTSQSSSLAYQTPIRSGFTDTSGNGNGWCSIYQASENVESAGAPVAKKIWDTPNGAKYMRPAIAAAAAARNSVMAFHHGRNRSRGLSLTTDLELSQPAYHTPQEGSPFSEDPDEIQAWSKQRPDAHQQQHGTFSPLTSSLAADFQPWQQHSPTDSDTPLGQGYYSAIGAGAPQFPYTPALDPRYSQPGGFMGPSYPFPVPPQHRWELPRGITLNLPPRPRTNYSVLFNDHGFPVESFNKDRFGYTILPNSRGAFMKPIPADATLESICQNIRGGALERVDFHDLQGRTCVGIFFISADEAMKYIKFCKAQGGVYWACSSIVSKVEAIPRGKGGHEPIKLNVSKGIRDGATRCLRITNLPNTIDIELFKSQVKNQSRFVTAEIESLTLLPESSHSHPTFTAFLRMATIGTALGARLRLASLRYYADSEFEFLPDPAERSLEELAYKWNSERYWDSVALAVERNVGQMAATAWGAGDWGSPTSQV